MAKIFQAFDSLLIEWNPVGPPLNVEDFPNSVHTFNKVGISFEAIVEDINDVSNSFAQDITPSSVSTALVKIFQIFLTALITVVNVG